MELDDATRDLLDGPHTAILATANADGRPQSTVIFVKRADQISEPSDSEARSLLDRYIAAFESSDAAALERTLREDAVLEMTGTRTWFSGLRTCMPFFRTQALGSPGDWRMVPTRANGQPAAAAYRRAGDGVHHAFGVAVLTTSASRITRIALFGDPALVCRFGLPPVAPPRPVA